MEGKKIVVPEGMLWAVCAERERLGSRMIQLTDEQILQGGLQYLDGELEKLIIPDLEVTSYHSEGVAEIYQRNGNNTAIKLVRRMFLAPEPEVPEEIKDLLFTQAHGIPEAKDGFQNLNDILLEAYRRGQRSK